MSLLDWMSDVDYEWRQRLQPVNLVIETDFSADEVRAAQHKFGAASRQLVADGALPKDIIKRYPALTLMILVGHAALAYDHGAYWDSFWDELGVVDRRAEFENELRKSTTDLLDKFSLARFPDVEQGDARRYVTTFTLHAGIPRQCLRDLLVLINQHISQGRPATGASLMEWLQEPGKEYRAAALDKPVVDFLTYGAEFAADILDRIVEFIEASSSDAGLVNRELDGSTTGLPEVLLDELTRQLTETQLDWKPLAGAGSSRPEFSYRIDDDEIVLRLPALPEATNDPWRVSFDGDIREVHQSRRWGGDAGTAAATVSIPAPVREVIISHPGRASLQIPLVTESDPLLTFDPAGRLIGRRERLKDSVWAIFPDDHVLIDAHGKTPVKCHDTGSPTGWIGWRSAFIELDDLTALQLVRGDDHVGTQRWVRKDARPRFQFGQVVDGVFAPDGRTVYSTRPSVVLPAVHTSPAPAWNVRVRRLGSSEWIADELHVSEALEKVLDPFNDIEGPQLGLFEVLVTGPVGSDLRSVFFLAEGLETSFAPAIRIPAAGGLTECTATIGSHGVSVSPEGLLRLSESDLYMELALTSGPTSSNALLRPCHVEIRSGEAGASTSWRMTPDVCDPDDFAQDRFAAIRAPGVEKVDFAYVSDHGDLLQRDPKPRRRPGDVHESRIQQFTDTARTRPGGRIVATLHTADGPVQMPVLFAQPRQLASNVELDADRLKFVDVASVEGLAAYVWRGTAPWLRAEVLPVVDGAAALPEHLIEQGQLICQLFIDDPWVYLEPPAIPPTDAFRVEQDGWSEDGTEEQKKLSRYLGSQRSAPTELGVIPEVWSALGRLHTDGKLDRFVGLTELLVSEPRKALEMLGDSIIPAGEKMRLFIQSKLVSHSFVIDETFNELHSHPWFGCMVELADVPSLHTNKDEVRMERAETLAYLKDRGGALLLELLKTGTSKHLGITSFDSSTLSLTSVPITELERQLREIQQVPRAQLHHDNLRGAVYEALCARNEWAKSEWLSELAKQTSFLLNPLKNSCPIAHHAITARLERLGSAGSVEDHWSRMPAQSLTLAVVSRLLAYKRIAGSYLNSRIYAGWAHMAQLCPTLVQNDVLIAEAIVLHFRRGDLIGDAI